MMEGRWRSAVVALCLSGARDVTSLTALTVFSVFLFFHRPVVRNAGMLRWCLSLARFGPFACRCLFHHEIRFAAESSLAYVVADEVPLTRAYAVSEEARFMMRLSAEDVEDLLMDCCMNGWQLLRRSGVTMKPDLWALGDLIRRVSKDGGLFYDLDRLARGDPLEGVELYLAFCEKPCRVSVFVGVMAWAGSKCRVEAEGGGLDVRQTRFRCKLCADKLMTALCFLK